MALSEEKKELQKKWREQNKEKLREYQRKAYKKNKERILAYKEEYRQKHAERIRENQRNYNKRNANDTIHKEKKRHRALFRKYGITPERYFALEAAQNYTCALCARTADQERFGFLNVDHCHETGAVRGLLCTPCNHAIGILGDNAEGLRKALNYIGKSCQP